MISWTFKGNKVSCSSCKEEFYCWGFGVHLMDRHNVKDLEEYRKECKVKFPNMVICFSCGQGFTSLHALKIHLNRCMLKNIYYRDMTKKMKVLKRKVSDYTERINKAYKDPSLYREIVFKRDNITANYKHLNLVELWEELKKKDRSKIEINPSER